VMPTALSSRAAASSAKRLGEAVTSTAIAADVAAALGSEKRRVGNVLTEVATRFHDVALVATREAERRAELAALAPQVLDVEALQSDVHDLSGLLAIVDNLRSEPR
jgi:hypothetical protein